MTATLGRHDTMRRRRRTAREPCPAPATRAPDPAWPDVLVAWCGAVRPEGDAATFAEHAAALLETLDQHRALTGAALERFGRALGAEGWPLDPIAGWLRTLALIAPHHAEGLAGFDAATALARGWASGFVRGAEESAVVDPTTGLCTPAVLAVRLREVFDQCRSLGVDPRFAYALGMIDIGPGAPLAHCAEGAVLGLIVTATFTSGETCAALDTRVAVLAPRTDELTHGLRRVELLAAEDHLLRRSSVVTWIEELPDDASVLDVYLVDLTR